MQRSLLEKSQTCLSYCSIHMRILITSAIEQIKKTNVPIFFIHGSEDNLFGEEDGFRS